MRRSIMAAVAAVPLFLGASSAFAMPVAVTTGAEAAALSVTRVSNGCGPFAHRGPYGGCRPNGYVAPRVCPPGFHLGPYGHVCRPNY